MSQKHPKIWDCCNTALPCEPGVDIILRNWSNIKWIFSPGDWKSVFWSWLTLSWVLTRQLLPCGTPVVCIWSWLTCSSKSNTAGQTWQHQGDRPRHGSRYCQVQVTQTKESCKTFTTFEQTQTNTKMAKKKWLIGQNMAKKRLKIAKKWPTINKKLANKHKTNVNGVRSWQKSKEQRPENGEQTFYKNFRPALKSNINWIFSTGDWKSIFWSLWTLSWVLCRLLLWVQQL